MPSAASEPAAPPISRVCWQPSYRIVASRFPPIDLFEKVADPADLDAVFQIEALTNSRLREQVGELRLVPAEDRVSGLGSSPIMAAFTHIAPDGARFNDGTFGAYYCARSVETAVVETRYHRARFLAATGEPAQEIDMRVYAADIDADLWDLRGRQDQYRALYDPDDYGASRIFARQQRAESSDGIAYSSVRDEGGECAALFRPRLVSNCRQDRHLTYVWNGERITNVYEKASFSPG
ncbi:RES family NAD+ phosphorylase [Erythrobacter sp.]|jgi:hypothetical protein|uniref:RES family NAD+ phosphorylase n=1 Tax=Erythrobacter sp. TaxID=1042 RepID=UPI002ECDEA0D|nr:RES family NAD+ phosphorylase [Erythrobacter sp.]